MHLLLAVATVAAGAAPHHPVPTTMPAQLVSAGEALLARVLPASHAAMFTVEAIGCDSATGNEVLEYEAAVQNATAAASASAKITLRGCTGVSVASALSWYLREELGTYESPSWSTLPPLRGLPPTLPVPATARRMVRPVRFSWYTNVCTASYSFAWWDWDRWQQEIDLMAMHGVNIMYAHTGTEHLQAQVWTELLGDNATRGLADFFSGPAFLAWFRMGNLKRWGGPMPASFLEKQHALQLKILPRLQSLGIIGVLPAFAGFVPDALAYAYPNASIQRGGLWLQPAEYSAVNVLSSTDPLFVKIGQAFLARYATAYAEVNYTLQGYYSADTFNENSPPSSDPAFLKRYAAATWGGMAAHDPGAVWVAQAWAFGAGYWTNSRLQAYLSGVSNVHMLLLDLVSDQMPLWNGEWPELHNIMPHSCCLANTSLSCANCPGECCDPAKTGNWQGLASSHNYKDYFGKDWIYCSLNNYGGNNGMFGLLPTILTAPAAAQKTVKGRGLNNMVGIGLTMEGIHTNWVINEGLLEQGWRFTPQDHESWYDDWVASFVKRRYGSSAPELVDAWEILANRSEVSVYNGPRGHYFGSWGNTRSLVTRRPFWASGVAAEWDAQYNIGTSAGFQGTAPRYNPKHLLRVLRLLLSAVQSVSALKDSRALAVDVVDLTTMMMADEYIIFKQQLDVAASGVAPSKTSIGVVAEKMVQNIRATDELLGSNENYLLGRWIADARAYGQVDDDRRLLEFNARNQVTLWGEALLIPGKHGGLTPPGPQDYAGKTWQGLFQDFYLPRQQLLFDMLGDAAQLAKQNRSSIDLATLASNFTAATLALEAKWGTSTDTSNMMFKPAGDTFDIASSLVATHGRVLDEHVWCATRNAGEGGYNTDKAGAIISWQLQSYMQNSSCPFPCLAMPWNAGYVTVLGCE